MKKPSKRWKEFCQIISIIDIGIGKQQRKLKKLNKQHDMLRMTITDYWQDVQTAQSKLKMLNVEDEVDALKFFFRRRENIRSLIESLVFDVSVVQQELEKIEIEIAKAESEKLRLEKRKDVLDELKKQLT
ncbi:hypothetical protein Ppb6_01919 [Photorhabdus australis subsp. thailandensis]|uniref:Type III secretion protein n=2 Tax=Photorhabdus TaxID=29487 RepID=A0A5B0XBN0_9GAMM|nr:MULTISPECIES: hypothetical protein [Photorhabdus]KAA1195519.1 hypothetical protein F0L16_02220 [Photorhabdus heterorhabditis]KOY62975.1 hypothetical protein AM629_05280 [Photorhabdus heterorhabditis]MBS9441015.1 hypothetical protein [Photorhabdus heterorhabditis]OCQ52860.1 hypothetical protein Ppb6_01919 [Photorhabdus australis subsp. thailandensis]